MSWFRGKDEKPKGVEENLSDLSCDETPTKRGPIQDKVA